MKNGVGMKKQEMFIHMKNTKKGRNIL